MRILPMTSELFLQLVLFTRFLPEHTQTRRVFLSRLRQQTHISATSCRLQPRLLPRNPITTVDAAPEPFIAARFLYRRARHSTRWRAPATLQTLLRWVHPARWSRELIPLVELLRLL